VNLEEMLQMADREVHQDSQFASFASVTRDYEQSVRLYNLWMRSSGREHDWKLSCLPEGIGAITDDVDARARVEHAIEFLRDVASELEAGLRMRFPAGFKPPLPTES
jgi:hypothetical protein